MSIKSILLSSLAGGIVCFLLGFLFYGIIFHQDFDNEIITAQPVLINPPRFLFLFLGNLVGGFFLTYVLRNFTSIDSASKAFVVGFSIFGLMGLYSNLITYARTDIITPQGILIDASILAVMGGASSFLIFYVLKWFKN